ncbi:MAG: hypothetical protein ACO388_07510 [Saprospiraceae bacterium]
MTSNDWLNIAQCARQRREQEGLSSWWCSSDHSRYIELMGAETIMLLKMAAQTLAEAAATR